MFYEFFCLVYNQYTTIGIFEHLFDQPINFIKPSLFLICFMVKNWLSKRNNFVLFIDR